MERRVGQCAGLEGEQRGDRVVPVLDASAQLGDLGGETSDLFVSGVADAGRLEVA
jgi:hypothetical protein